MKPPNPFCKSCVVVSATSMLGWRKCLPGPFPSLVTASWGLEPKPPQEAEASRGSVVGWSSHDVPYSSLSLSRSQT